MTDAGKEPVWPDEMAKIDVKYIGDDMHLAVMDEEVGADDTVGSATIKLSALCHDGIDEWFRLDFDGQHAGDIHLKSKWTPKGETLKELPKPEEAQRPELYYTNGTVAPPVQYIPVPVMIQYPTYYMQ